MSITVPDFRSQIATVEELEETIVFYFPHQQNYLARFYKQSDLTNGSVEYETNGQIETLGITIYRNGRTVAKIVNAATGTTSVVVARENYVAAIQGLRQAWNDIHGAYAPIG